jgi:hypothetical protein
MAIDSQWLFKNSKGKPDGAWTGAWLTLMVVLARYLLSGDTIAFGKFSYTFSAVDATAMGVLLGATWGSYCWRKGTEAKYTADDKTVPKS